MFEVRFYKFNKKINSTKLPNVPYVTEFCNIKTPTSYTNPTLELEVPFTKKPDYNYCYILPFNRYYFISNITYDTGVWILDLKDDVLSSFKNDILNSSQYVLRSASDYSAIIKDDIYPSTILHPSKRWKIEEYGGYGGLPNNVRFYDIYNKQLQSAVPYFNKGIYEGTFVIGVIGNNTTGITYYAMNYSAFKSFINKALTLVPSDMTDVSSGIANAIYNPMQYISNCIWYPHVYITTEGSSDITLGAYTITLSGNNKVYEIEISHMPYYYIQINIPEHPDYNANRRYLNLSPYTELNLYFLPFGNIPIDTTKIFDETRLMITWVVDYTTGTAKLTVVPDRDIGVEYKENVIYEGEVTYGVPISLSSMQVDWKVGLGLSALSWLKNNATEGGLGEIRAKAQMNYIQKNYLESRGIDTTPMNKSSEVVDNVSGALSSALGQINTKGGTGSFLPYAFGKPYIYACYYGQTEQDISRFGKPLRQVKLLNNLSGFCLCENAHVTSYASTKPLLSEQLEIENYLNSGFYIE